MYSYEDSIRAVKLYIKLGKRTGATIRQLEYPTKSRRDQTWGISRPSAAITFDAAAATLFGSLKAERLHGQRFETRRHARDEAISRLLWHSRTRLHPTLAYISQMLLEQN
jgi:hypothetical protein